MARRSFSLNTAIIVKRIAIDSGISYNEAFGAFNSFVNATKIDVDTKKTETNTHHHWYKSTYSRNLSLSMKCLHHKKN